jgi:hypothetical protein
VETNQDASAASHQDGRSASAGSAARDTPVVTGTPVIPEPTKGERAVGSTKSTGTRRAGTGTMPKTAASHELSRQPGGPSSGKPPTGSGAPNESSGAGTCGKAVFASVYNAPAPTKDEVRTALRALVACHAAGSISNADFDQTRDALVTKL